MTLKLPRRFADVELADLWYTLQLAQELAELSNSADEASYWEGWSDGVIMLLGDLTHRKVITRRDEFSIKFHDFRMEDHLSQLEKELFEND